VLVLHLVTWHLSGFWEKKVPFAYHNTYFVVSELIISF
jgi:hypothetical protein